MASWAAPSDMKGRLAVEKTAKFAVVSSSSAQKAESSTKPSDDVGTKRRDSLLSIESAVQSAWSETGAFEADADEKRPKFMVTFP